jgi:hypothetical protein
MSRGGAFGEEMQSLRVLTDGDQELTSFLQEIRATLVAPPTGALATALPARLAEEARGAAPPSIAMNGAASRHRAMNGGASRRRRRSPFARPLLRVAVAIAAIPLLFTGLAFAGVNLPDPASSAFESIGIDLPNQAEGAQGGGSGGDDDGAGTAHDGDSAGSAGGQSNSSGTLGDGTANQGPNADGAPGKDQEVTGEGVAPVETGPSGEQGDATDKPDAPPGGGQSNGGPPEAPGAPEDPGSQAKPPGGVPMYGPRASDEGVDPSELDDPPQ